MLRGFAWPLREDDIDNTTLGCEGAALPFKSVPGGASAASVERVSAPRPCNARAETGVRACCPNVGVRGSNASVQGRRPTAMFAPSVEHSRRDLAIERRAPPLLAGGSAPSRPRGRRLAHQGATPPPNTWCETPSLHALRTLRCVLRRRVLHSSILPKHYAGFRDLVCFTGVGHQDVESGFPRVVVAAIACHGLLAPWREAGEPASRAPLEVFRHF